MFSKSPEKIDVIPLISISLSVLNTWFRVVYDIPVLTIGDWTILSIDSKHFSLDSVEIKKWPVPIPRASTSRTWGLASKAWVADAATLIERSASFTTNNVGGNLSVDPTPGIVVVTIPIGELSPECLYVICSPVTKKWFGSINWFVDVSTIVESDPSKYFSNTVFPLCLISNRLLISLSVPR